MPEYSDQGSAGMLHAALAYGREAVRSLFAKNKVEDAENRRPHSVIAERKQAAGEMRHGEQEFHSLAENLPDGIARLSSLAASVPGFIFTIRVGPDGHTSFPFASAAIQDIFGLSPEDILADAAPLRAMYHPDDLPRHMQAVRESAREMTPFRNEIRVLPPGKGELWVEIRSMPQREPDGGTVWHGIMLDITAGKRAEEQLRASEKEYRSLLENSPDTIVRYDRDCRRVYVNPTQGCVSARPLSDMLGKTPVEDWMFPTEPEAALAFQNHIRQVLDTGNACEWELAWKGEDGLPVCYSLRGVPEFNREGRVEYALMFARDISARVRAEQRLRSREQEFRTLAENSPNMIARYDRDCRRVYVNPAYERETGIPVSRATGATVEEVWRPVNLAAEEYRARLRQVMETGMPTRIILEWSGPEKQLISHSFHVVPEYDADGQVVGTLALGHNISRLRRQEVLEAARVQIFERLAHGGELAEILGLVVAYVEKARPDFLCSILLLDVDGKHLLTGAAPSLPDEYNTAINGIEIGEGVGCCGTAAWRGEGVIAEDIRTHPYWENYKAWALKAGLLACWSEPIFEARGKVLGIFAIYQRQPGRPTHEDMELIRQACNLSAIAIERKRIEDKMQRQASYDSLTGLPNRRLFGNRLREAISKADRTAGNVALLFIDLDRFKEVNDTLGHDVGDRLLVEAAQRIRQCVRESDTVARLGGDEFVVVIPDVVEITHLVRIAQAILDVLAEPLLLASHTAYVSASIGIASYPMDADSMEVLVSYADQAMYAAKEQGRNGFRFFTPSMQLLAQQRLQLASDLHDALAHGQLQICLQPIVDIATGQVVKAEALLRWRHPHRGMVAPDVFIPLAEDMGAIHEIGDWVFREAAAAAKRWLEMRIAGGNAGAPCQVSVNISPRQFVGSGIGESWIDYLENIGLPAECIAIEITEGLLLKDQDDVMNKLGRFRAAGIQVALDDFGTGYSAMAYLKKFNIDYLKIDRSFVRDLVIDSNDRAIVEAIIVMAHKLGLKCIAEGVETVEQRDLLAAAGCEYVQGYFYSQPMLIDKFMAYVHDMDSVARSAV